MKSGEVIGTGVWLFSAVKVAGYTWDVYMGNYQGFPSPQGNVGGGVTTAINSALNSIPVIGPVLGFAAKGWEDIGNALSGG